MRSVGVGALFVVGDCDAVLAQSRPLILDPLHGHPRDRRAAEAGADGTHSVRERAPTTRHDPRRAARYAVRSERGLREDNQDAAFASARLLVVGDGMGGHAAGEVASSLMVDALAHLGDVSIEEEHLLTALREATDRGNEHIAQHTIRHPATAGMGTTLTAAALRGRRLGLVHVGDTRAYRDRAPVQSPPRHQRRRSSTRCERTGFLLVRADF